MSDEDKFKSENLVKYLEEKYSTEPKTYTQMFDECYNTGVEHCIEIAKDCYTPQPNTSINIILDYLLKSFEQLKKPPL